MRRTITTLLAALIALPVIGVGPARAMAAPTSAVTESVLLTAQGDDPAKPPAEPVVKSPSQTESGGKKQNASPEKPVNTSKIYSPAGYDITPLPRATVAELAKKLDPEAYRITQESGTERPFCGGLLDNKKEGTYCCVVCGLPLFSSDHKFNSGTG